MSFFELKIWAFRTKFVHVSSTGSSKIQKYRFLELITSIGLNSNFNANLELLISVIQVFSAEAFENQKYRVSMSLPSFLDTELKFRTLETFSTFILQIRSFFFIVASSMKPRILTIRIQSDGLKFFKFFEFGERNSSFYSTKQNRAFFNCFSFPRRFLSTENVLRIGIIIRFQFSYFSEFQALFRKNFQTSKNCRTIINKRNQVSIFETKILSFFFPRLLELFSDLFFSSFFFSLTAATRH